MSIIAVNTSLNPTPGPIPKNNDVKLNVDTFEELCRCFIVAVDLLSVLDDMIPTYFNYPYSDIKRMLRLSPFNIKYLVKSKSDELRFIQILKNYVRFIYLSKYEEHCNTKISTDDRKKRTLENAYLRVCIVVDVNNVIISLKNGPYLGMANQLRDVSKNYAEQIRDAYCAGTLDKLEIAHRDDTRAYAYIPLKYFKDRLHSGLSAELTRMNKHHIYMDIRERLLVTPCIGDSSTKYITFKH